ncbi:MAG TPA: phosphatase PAP2 family protein [Immundisolibacter sp.]
MGTVIWPDKRALWGGRDRRCAILLHQAAGRYRLVGPLILASRLGDGGLWYALMLIIPWLDPVNGLFCTLQMAVVGAVNVVLYLTVKRRVGRPRPFRACPGITACTPALAEFSFPSGHTLHATAFAVLLSYHYPVVAPAAWLFVALVAVSRIVLGLHYPSDVAAGALTGIATGGIAIVLGRLLAI